LGPPQALRKLLRFPQPEPAMKDKIHPEYVNCKVNCGCGNNFMTRASVTEMHVEICSACHPFYTGKQKFVDTAGRIEKFNKKFKGFDSTGESKEPATEAAAS
jgi:large subunit ribosomal protein L31